MLIRFFFLFILNEKKNKTFYLLFIWPLKTLFVCGTYTLYSLDWRCLSSVVLAFPFKLFYLIRIASVVHIAYSCRIYSHSLCGTCVVGRCYQYTFMCYVRPQICAHMQAKEFPTEELSRIEVLLLVCRYFFFCSASSFMFHSINFNRFTEHSVDFRSP